MPNLETEVNQLIRIFPREMDRVYVVPIINNSNELKFLYVQKGTEDTRRNWTSYREWKQKNGEHIQKQEGMIKFHLSLPDDFDDIYHRSISSIEDKSISPDDKILLEVYLRQDTETKDDVLHLAHIQRNRGSDLKGLGEEFYKNMLPWLKNKGYNFLKGLPAGSRLESYWQQLGQVPIASLDVKQREYLTTPKMPSCTYVHILS